MQSWLSHGRKKRRARNNKSVTKKLSDRCLEKNHVTKLVSGKNKRKLQKVIVQSQHTVLTENNRKLHQNQLSILLTFQPHYSHRAELTLRGKQKRGDDGTFMFSNDEEM